MEKAKFCSVTYTLKLEAQSPMVHFQAFTDGATIRPSEVKPKLDKFIIEKLLKHTKATSLAELRKGEYKDIFQSDKGDADNDALDYKMQILCDEAPVVIPLNIQAGKAPNELKNQLKKIGNAQAYALFYGNSGQKMDDQKFGVFSNPTVRIICFNEKIRTLIEQYIEEFFLVTNFGTMQSKGFGSFAPAHLIERKNAQEAGKISADTMTQVAAYLKEKNGGECYYFDYSDFPRTDSSKGKVDQNKDSRNQKNSRCIKMFEDIIMFYSIMKTGRNISKTDRKTGKVATDYVRSYIYQYMHEKHGVDNEKAYAKQQGMAPILNTSGRGREYLDRVDQNPKYVRALLGTGENVGYKKSETGFDRVNVSMKHKRETLERVSSPIYFKIVGDKVFITATEIPDEIWEQEFTFSGQGKTGVLSTPKKEEFDIRDFLASYVAFFNSDELRNGNEKNPHHVKALMGERKVQTVK